jgi:hypothetical protein
MSRRLQGVGAVAILSAATVWISDGATAQERGSQGCLKGSPAELNLHDGRTLEVRLFSITRNDGRRQQSDETCRRRLDDPLTGQRFTLRLPVAASQVTGSIGCSRGRGASDHGGIGTTKSLERVSPRRWRAVFAERPDTPRCDLNFYVRSVRRGTVRGYSVWW